MYSAEMKDFIKKTSALFLLNMFCHFVLTLNLSKADTRPHRASLTKGDAGTSVDRQRHAAQARYGILDAQGLEVAEERKVSQFALEGPVCYTYQHYPSSSQAPSSRPSSSRSDRRSLDASIASLSINDSGSEA